ncbi:LxmA leader domain family RiPP [Nonomuraea sp. NPDC050310]
MAEKDLVDGYKAYTDSEEIAFDENAQEEAPTSPWCVLSIVVTASAGC